MKVTIYYATKDVTAVDRIREKYGFPRYMTINGEQEVNISPEELKSLTEEEKGLVVIRRTEQ